MHHPDTVTTSNTSRRFPARSLLGAALVAVVLPLSACGGHGDAEGRPSVKEITQSLTSGSLAQEMGLDKTGAPQSTFACVAQKLEDSDLSDAALAALVKADDSFQPSDDDQKALSDLPSQMATCATQ